MPNINVDKISIFTKKEKLTFAALAAVFLFFLTRYVIWWFQPNHIPENWINSYFHIFDLLIFILLTFVVFIGSTQKLGNLFALWFASKPVPLAPHQGLKVAFLTCFVPGKEPIEMLIDTLCAMKNVRYPHETWVLDEGNSGEVKKICKLLDVKYFTRFGIDKYNQDQGKFRAKTKAGNHNAWADSYAKYYDIVAQVDMDYVSEPDFLEKTLGYFNDSKVAFVVMPQFYKNTQNWIAKGAGEQAFFFNGPMQQGFYGCDMPFLIGTSHIYRTLALNQIGGYAPTIVEDHLTGMNFYKHGWKGVYVPEILAKGEGPLNWVDYFNQQMRWSYGLFEIFFKHTPKIILKLKWRQQVNYFIAQLYYFTGVAVVLGFILTFMYLVFGIQSASMGLLEWLKYSFPPFLVGIALQIYTHRFGIDPKNEPAFGLLGMFLNLGANIIYALAFVKFILGQKLIYMVTQKGSAGQKQTVPMKTFTLHILFAALMLFALIESFITNHSAIQLRLWAVFNVMTLSAVSLSIYWEHLRARLSFLRLNAPIFRYGLSATFGVVLFLTFALTYSYYGTTVKASFSNVFVPETNIPLAGKVLPPQKGVLFGVSIYQHNDTNYLNRLQAQLDKKFAILGYYQSWGVEESHFDKAWAENISSNGSIPFVTWEPWIPVSGFDRSESLVDQKDYRLINIINGDYDNYISQYAQDIKSYKKPVMIRFAQEMNGNWYPWGSTFNSPEDYVLAFRHVHEIFDSIGATNLTWVWSPNEAYFDQRVPYAHQIEAFYPGDDYVDWVGFSAFNWAGSYKHNVWRSPEDLYGDTFAKLKQFNKPIMITETASAESNDNKTLKGEWIKKLSAYIMANPEIKGVIWFNTQDNGVNWTIGSSEYSLNAFKDSFGSYFFEEIK